MGGRSDRRAAGADRIGHRHRGGGYYASIDGSTHWFKEPLTANSWNWHSRGVGGRMESLGHVPKTSACRVTNHRFPPGHFKNGTSDP